MFQRVMDWLADEPVGHDQGFADHEIRICVAALFYHMIAVDGEVTEGEKRQLRQLLLERYRLNDHQLIQLERDGEESDRGSAGLFPFAVILNHQMDQRQKQQVFDQLKLLAMADGKVHDLEQGMLDHVQVLLKLSPVQ
jgi:uncharacterized tellurite resistance protein B-like protein